VSHARNGSEPNHSNISELYELRRHRIDLALEDLIDRISSGQRTYGIVDRKGRIDWQLFAHHQVLSDLALGASSVSSIARQGHSRLIDFVRQVRRSNPEPARVREVTESPRQRISEIPRSSGPRAREIHHPHGTFKDSVIANAVGLVLRDTLGHLIGAGKPPVFVAAAGHIKWSELTRVMVEVLGYPVSEEALRRVINERYASLVRELSDNVITVKASPIESWLQKRKLGLW